MDPTYGSLPFSYLQGTSGTQKPFPPRSGNARDSGDELNQPQEAFSYLDPTGEHRTANRLSATPEEDIYPKAPPWEDGPRPDKYLSGFEFDDTKLEQRQTPSAISVDSAYDESRPDLSKSDNKGRDNNGFFDDNIRMFPNTSKPHLAANSSNSFPRSFPPGDIAHSVHSNEREQHASVSSDLSDDIRHDGFSMCSMIITVVIVAVLCLAVGFTVGWIVRQNLSVNSCSNACEFMDRNTTTTSSSVTSQDVMVTTATYDKGTSAGQAHAASNTTT